MAFAWACAKSRVVPAGIKVQSKAETRAVDSRVRPPANEAARKARDAGSLRQPNRNASPGERARRPTESTGPVRHPTTSSISALFPASSDTRLARDLSRSARSAACSEQAESGE